ncbi:centrosomal protein of 41 kDa-like isoform X1 [Poecile atricapillus]|uniref:centrosomal protein of 41 kDa-like isoform X1 n=1 Tax=Poecile atricapillus TaxID=48891 RepID=UPI002739F470|nr:centrosomal protein of 41 kDa-like isoform X1 [Poecile atricapillus]
MSARGGFGDPQLLTRRIPTNPKYQHIKTRLDTGNSLSKYMEKLEEIKRNYRYKKDELFKRLKVTTFAQLVLQVASLSNETLEVTKEELQELPDSAGDDTEGTKNDQGSPEGMASPVLFLNNSGAGESHRSTLQSVISGVGELDLEKDSPKEEESQARETPYPDCPFLLLDVRDRDAYEQCHIVGAYSYPIATLSRTMNPYTNNILEYKNAHGKIIIVYDNDERLASQAATTMCERGFENLFMLSGGLKVLAQKIPEGLITGTLPASCQLPAPGGSARRRAVPRAPPARAENRWRFSADDLQKLRRYLAEEQLPSDAASRLTRGVSSHDSKLSSARSNPSFPSSAGTVGSLSSRSHRTSIQNRPWK